MVTSKLNIVLFCAIYLISVLPSLLSCFSSGNISLPEVPAKRKIQTSHCRSPSVRQRSVSPSMRHRSRTRERQNRNRSLSRESSSQRPSTSYASETRRRAPESHKRNAEFPMTEERKFFFTLLEKCLHISREK
jgi:hypothetical protein